MVDLQSRHMRMSRVVVTISGGFSVFIVAKRAKGQQQST